MPVHRRVAGWAFLALGVLLPIGWLIACIKNWHDVVHHHPRLGFLIGDVAMVTPLSLLVGIWLLRRRPLGPPVLMLAIGALAYDVVVFCVFLVQDDIFLPGGVWIAIWAVVLGILAWFVAGELRMAAE